LWAETNQQIRVLDEDQQIRVLGAEKQESALSWFSAEESKNRFNPALLSAQMNERSESKMGPRLCPEVECLLLTLKLIKCIIGTRNMPRRTPLNPNTLTHWSRRCFFFFYVYLRPLRGFRN